MEKENKVVKTVEEVIKAHVDRLTENPEQMKPFFNGGLAIQNDPTNYDPEYLNNKMHITCEVLCQVGFCNNNLCQTCAITAAHERALEEIAEGIRKKEVRQHSKYKKPNVSWKKDYYMEVTVDSKTGVVKQVLTPIKLEE